MDGNGSDTTEELLAATYKKYLIAYMPIIVIMCITTIVGIVGNIFTLHFYCSQSRKTSTIVFIIALTGLDLTVCFMAIATIIDMSVNVYFKGPALCKAIYFFAHGTILSSMLVLVIISVDRYRKICHPFKRQFQIKTAIIIIFVLVGIAFAYAIPSWFTYDILTLNLTAPNGNHVFGNYCTNPENPELKVLVMTAHACDGLLVILILVTFLVTYGNIWRVLRKHKIQTSILVTRAITTTEGSTLERDNDTHTSLDTSEIRDSLDGNARTVESSDSGQPSTIDVSSSGGFRSVPKYHESSSSTNERQTKEQNTRASPSRSERNITVMMFAVSIGYVCCFTPYIIVLIIRVVTSAGEAEMEAWIQFLLRTPFYNSVINPIIFSYFNPQFRRHIKERIIGCKHGQCMNN